MRNKWPFIGLGVLAVVTVVLMVLAVLHVRPSGTEAVPAATGGPSAPTLTGGAWPPTASPTPAPSPRPPRTSSIDNIKTLLKSPEPARIVVVGDGTGRDSANAQGWVTLWADKLAEGRPVQLRTVGATGGYGPADDLGRGTGAAIEIRNASDRPGKLSDITADVAELVPQDTDVVIINVGHNESSVGLTSALNALVEEIPDGSMALIMLQNPQRGNGQADQQGRVREIRRWAEAQRLPVVDINAAFLRDPLPLAQLVLADNTNPSRAGAEVWRNAMVSTLG